MNINSVSVSGTMQQVQLTVLRKTLDLAASQASSLVEQMEKVSSDTSAHKVDISV